MNTTLTGNQLRDAAYRIVSAAQKKNCAKEKPVSGKAVDVYFEELVPFSKNIIKFGVECKNYNSVFTRSEFDKIFNTYHQAYVANEIHILIIITKHHPATKVYDSLENHAWITLKTFDEFCSEFMDFRKYLGSLQAAFSNEGLVKYYVPIIDTNGNDIEEGINRWIASDDSRPKAILAGYGMGKTSFSQKMAFKYATRYLEGDSVRIPIYLRLGDIFHEQSIEGLICRYFSSLNQVPGFNYELFKVYNSYGLFLIILDGFDEMKFAMSFSSFKRNIQEFNHLIVDNSKVIVLGRPNAFTSEDETKSTLHGIRHIGKTEIKEATLPDYDSIEISVFSKSQLDLFIPNYLSYLSSQESVRRNNFVDTEFCNMRARELLSERFFELISRPVHARMLAIISLSTNMELSEFSTYDLYRDFIDRILDREVMRPAREKIDSDKRRSFISKVAWLRWLKGGDRGFTFADLSEIDLDSGFEDLPKDQVLRDLIIGSVLERKGDYFYFAHRSFQEFLVAEFLVSGRWSASNLGEVDKALSEGVIDFLEANIGEKRLFVDRFVESLNLSKSSISISTISYISGGIGPVDPGDLFDISDDASAWEVVLKVLACKDILTYASVAGWPVIARYLSHHDKVHAFLSALTYRIISGCINSSITKKDEDSIVISLLGILHILNLDAIRRMPIQKGALKDFAIENICDKSWMLILLSCVGPRFNAAKELEFLELDIGKLMEALLLNSMGGYGLVMEVDINKKIRMPILYLDEGIAVLFKPPPGTSKDELGRYLEAVRSERQKLVRFWRSKPSIDALVPVERRCGEKKAAVPKRPTITLKNRQ